MTCEKTRPSRCTMTQPSPYSEPSSPACHLASELAAVVVELSHDSLETLLMVARRLASVEEERR